MDAPLRRLEIGEDAHEPLRREIVENLIGQRPGESEPLPRHGQRRLDMVHGEVRPESDDARAPVLFEPPFGRAGHGAGVNQGMADEGAGVGRAAGPGEIIGRHHDIAAGRADLPGHEIRVGQRADADRDIEAFADEIAVAVIEREIDGDARMVGEEAGEGRRHMEPAEDHRGRDAHFPRERAALGGGAQDLAIGREQSARLLLERPALGGDRQFSRRAVEEPHAEPILETTEDPRDGGARPAQPPAGRGEAAGIEHGKKDFEFVEPVHSSDYRKNELRRQAVPDRCAMVNGGARHITERAMKEPSLVLYGTRLSGHCHRVEALLGQLGLPYAYREAPAAVRQSSDYRRIAPFGQIPVLVDGERVIADSAAILVYLCRAYDPDGAWLPRDLEREVEIQRWLAVAAGDIRFGPALARLITRFGAPGDLTAAHRVAHALFAFMQVHLAGRDWLVGERPSIADLACYAYLAVADEGGLSLDATPALPAWIARVEAIPSFLRMPRS